MLELSRLIVVADHRPQVWLTVPDQIKNYSFSETGTSRAVTHLGLFFADGIGVISFLPLRGIHILHVSEEFVALVDNVWEASAR